MKFKLLALYFSFAWFFIDTIQAQRDWSAVLEEQRTVLLGEQAHGVKTFYDEKQRIVQELSDQSTKEILLLIESLLVLSVLRYLENEPSNYHYNHTNTPENISFFKNYKNFGIDLQEDCRYVEFGAYLIQKGYCEATNEHIARMDSILSLCILGKNYVKDQINQSEYELLKDAVSSLEENVMPHVENGNDATLLRLCFENRRRLAVYLKLSTGKGYQERIQFRDSIMAQNVVFYTDHFNAYQPVVWAANLHVGRNGVMGKKWNRQGVKSMAAYLSEERPIYSIAIDSKSRNKADYFYDEVILTKERILVDPTYLLPLCGN